MKPQVPTKHSPSPGTPILAACPSWAANMSSAAQPAASPKVRRLLSSAWVWESWGGPQRLVLQGRNYNTKPSLVCGTLQTATMNKSHSSIKKETRVGPCSLSSRMAIADKKYSSAERGCPTSFCHVLHTVAFISGRNSGWTLMSSHSPTLFCYFYAIPCHPIPTYVPCDQPWDRAWLHFLQLPQQRNAPEAMATACLGTPRHGTSAFGRFWKIVQIKRRRDSGSRQNWCGKMLLKMLQVWKVPWFFRLKVYCLEWPTALAAILFGNACSPIFSYDTVSVWLWHTYQESLGASHAISVQPADGFCYLRSKEFHWRCKFRKSTAATKHANYQLLGRRVKPPFGA